MANHSNFVATLIVWAVPTVFAIIAHEVMHGVIARTFGDDTAERAGRLTLNPLPHVDPFGTVILPALLLFLRLPVFGYARPVPVDFRRLNPARLGMILVAAAGPVTNFTLAILSALGLRMVFHPDASGLALAGAKMLYASVLVNVMLGVFNLFPILPLDGGRVLAGILPARLARGYARLERYGILILFLLLYTDWVDMVIDPIIRAITRTLL